MYYNYEMEKKVNELSMYITIIKKICLWGFA